MWWIDNLLRSECKEFFISPSAGGVVVVVVVGQLLLLQLWVSTSFIVLFGVIDNQKLVFDVQNDPPPPGKGESQNRLLDCWPPAQLKEQSVQCPQGPQAPSTRVEKIFIFAKGIDFVVGFKEQDTHKNNIYLLL